MQCRRKPGPPRPLASRHVDAPTSNQPSKPAKPPKPTRAPRLPRPLNNGAHTGIRAAAVDVSYSVLSGAIDNDPATMCLLGISDFGHDISA